jgi:DNA-directed RNA polymerase beta subunit
MDFAQRHFSVETLPMCNAAAVFVRVGYDMEDAMILNKSSMERGLGHGTLIKCEMLDLREDRGKKNIFAAEPHDQRSRVRRQDWLGSQGGGVVIGDAL